MLIITLIDVNFMYDTTYDATVVLYNDNGALATLSSYVGIVHG